MAKITDRLRIIGAAGVAAGLLAFPTPGEAPPSTGASVHRTGVTQVFAGYDGEIQIIPQRPTREVIVTFSRQEQQMAQTGLVSVDEQLTGTGWSAGFRPTADKRRFEVNIPSSAGNVQAKNILRS